MKFSQQRKKVRQLLDEKRWQTFRRTEASLRGLLWVFVIGAGLGLLWGNSPKVRWTSLGFGMVSLIGALKIRSLLLWIWPQKQQTIENERPGNEPPSGPEVFDDEPRSHDGSNP